MVEAPILFQDRLVRALLEGRKTQTRRVGPNAIRFLKLNVGDVLWVRETWAPLCHAGDERCWSPDDPEHLQAYHRTEYRADTGNPRPGEWPDEPGNPRWRPSIHMPRFACRLLLPLVQKPRVERLQDLTEADAIAEGVMTLQPGSGWAGAQPDPRRGPTRHESPRLAFASLWDSINAPRGYGWDQNPEVVVLTFEVSRLPSLPRREQRIHEVRGTPSEPR